MAAVVGDPMVTDRPVCICGADNFTTVHVYRQPPEGEVRFDFEGTYRRELARCGECGHFRSIHSMVPDSFYEQSYVDSTYGARLRGNFERVNSLPPERSDNLARVERVCEFAREHLEPEAGTSQLLDVGSGLCVFGYRMAQRGWEVTAVDRDERLVEHARAGAGVTALRGDVVAGIEGLAHYDVITLNKVLEHVVDPIEMLAAAARYRSDGAFVYIELPDGEAAIDDPLGAGREEFFVEHHHAFSLDSVQVLARGAGLRAARVERVQEPSSKYTLYAFLVA